MAKSNEKKKAAERCRWCGLESPLGTGMAPDAGDEGEAVECRMGAVVYFTLDGLGALAEHSAKDILPALKALEACLDGVCDDEFAQWGGSLGSYQLLFLAPKDDLKKAARSAVKAMLALQDQVDAILNQLALSGLVLAPKMAAHVSRNAALFLGEGWQLLPEVREILRWLVHHSAHYSASTSEDVVDLIGHHLQTIPLEVERGPGAFQVLAWLDTGPERPALDLDGFSSGRDDELRHFTRRWQDVSAGEGPRIITLVGPDGSGKRRLVEEFIFQVLDGVPGTYALGAACPQTQLMPLAPLGEALLDLLEVSPYDSEEEVWRRLLHGARLASKNLQSREVEGEAKTMAALIARLLGLEGGASTRMPLADLSPEVLRDRGFFALRRLLGGLCHERPRLLVFSDLHYADSTTRAFIQSLGEEEMPGRGRLLVILTSDIAFAESQTDAVSGWKNHEVIRLAKLPGESLREIGEGVATRRGEIPAWLMDDFVERVAGDPYFMEQLAYLAAGKAGGDEAAGAADKAPFDDDDMLIDEEASTEREDWPKALDEVLRRRLLALDDASRSLLQLAATVGSTFAENLVRQLWDEEQGEDTSATIFARLVAQGFIRRCPGAKSYRFRGYGLWQAALKSRGEADIGRWSHRVARLLQNGKYGNRLRAYYAPVAAHFQRCNMGSTALRYYVLAARHAQKLGASHEAEICYSRAQDISRAKSDEDLEDNRAIYLLRGQLRLSLGSWQEAIEDLNAAADLAKLQGKPEAESEALLALCQALDHSRWLDDSEGLELRLFEASEASGDAFLRLRRLMQAGWARFHTGEPKAAQAFFEEAVQFVGNHHLESRHLAKVLHEFGLLQWHRGDYDEARNVFRKLATLMQKS